MPSIARKDGDCAVRSVSPSALAERILEQLSAARDGCAPRLDLDLPPPAPRGTGQPRLRL